MALLAMQWLYEGSHWGAGGKEGGGLQKEAPSRLNGWQNRRKEQVCSGDPQCVSEGQESKMRVS